MDINWNDEWVNVKKALSAKLDSCRAPPYSPKTFLSLLIVYPVIRVQLLCQTQGTLVEQGLISRPYHGLTECFSQVIESEGVGNLWKRASIYVVSNAMRQLLNRLLSDIIEKVTPVEMSLTDEALWEWFISLAENLLLGTLGDMINHGHTKFTADIKDAKFSQWKFATPVDPFLTTIKSEGLAGLLIGSPISRCQNLVTEAVFRLSEFLVNKAPSKQDEKYPTVSLMTKHVPHILGVLVGYPFETVKQRMILMTPQERAKHRNHIKNFDHILKKEGFLSFYKGFPAKMVYLGVTSSIFWILTKSLKYGSTGGSNADTKREQNRLNYTKGNTRCWNTNINSVSEVGPWNPEVPGLNMMDKTVLSEKGKLSDVSSGKELSPYANAQNQLNETTARSLSCAKRCILVGDFASAKKLLNDSYSRTSRPENIYVKSLLFKKFISNPVLLSMSNTKPRTPMKWNTSNVPAVYSTIKCSGRPGFSYTNPVFKDFLARLPYN